MTAVLTEWRHATRLMRLGRSALLRLQNARLAAAWQAWREATTAAAERGHAAKALLERQVTVAPTANSMQKLSVGKQYPSVTHAVQFQYYFTNVWWH